MALKTPEQWLEEDRLLQQQIDAPPSFEANLFQIGSPLDLGITPDPQALGVQGLIAMPGTQAKLPQEVIDELSAQIDGPLDQSLTNLIAAHYDVFGEYPDFSLTADLLTKGEVKFETYEEALKFFEVVKESYTGTGREWQLDASRTTGKGMPVLGAEIDKNQNGQFTDETDVLDPEMIASFRPKKVEDFLFGPYMKRTKNGRTQMFRDGALKLDEMLIVLPKQWAISQLGVSLEREVRLDNPDIAEDEGLMLKLNQFIASRVPDQYKPAATAAWQDKTESGLRYLQQMRASALYIASADNGEARGEQAVQAAAFLQSNAYGDIITVLDQQIRQMAMPSGSTPEERRKATDANAAFVEQMWLASRNPGVLPDVALQQLYDMNPNATTLATQQQVGRDHMMARFGMLLGWIPDLYEKIPGHESVNAVWESDEAKAARGWIPGTVGAIVRTLEPLITFVDKGYEVGHMALTTAHQMQQDEGGNWYTNPESIPASEQRSAAFAEYLTIHNAESPDDMENVNSFVDRWKFYWHNNQDAHNAGIPMQYTDELMRDGGHNPAANPEMSFVLGFAFEMLIEAAALKGIGLGAKTIGKIGVTTAKYGETTVGSITRRKSASLLHIKTMEQVAHNLAKNSGLAKALELTTEEPFRGRNVDWQTLKNVAGDPTAPGARVMNRKNFAQSMVDTIGVMGDEAADLGDRIVAGKLLTGEKGSTAQILREGLPKMTKGAKGIINPDTWAIHERFKEIVLFNENSKFYRGDHPFISYFLERTYNLRRTDLSDGNIEAAAQRLASSYRTTIGRSENGFDFAIADALAHARSLEDLRALKEIEASGNTNRLAEFLGGEMIYSRKTVDAIIEKEWLLTKKAELAAAQHFALDELPGEILTDAEAVAERVRRAKAIPATVRRIEHKLEIGRAAVEKEAWSLEQKARIKKATTLKEKKALEKEEYIPDKSLHENRRTDLREESFNRLEKLNNDLLWIDESEGRYIRKLKKNKPLYAQWMRWSKERGFQKMNKETGKMEDIVHIPLLAQIRDWQILQTPKNDRLVMSIREMKEMSAQSVESYVGVQKGRNPYAVMLPKQGMNEARQETSRAFRYDLVDEIELRLQDKLQSDEWLLKELQAPMPKIIQTRSFTKAEETAATQAQEAALTLLDTAQKHVQKKGEDLLKYQDRIYGLTMDHIQARELAQAKYEAGLTVEAVKKLGKVNRGTLKKLLAEQETLQHNAVMQRFDALRAEYTAARTEQDAVLAEMDRLGFPPEMGEPGARVQSAQRTVDNIQSLLAEKQNRMPTSTPTHVADMVSTAENMVLETEAALQKRLQRTGLDLGEVDPEDFARSVFEDFEGTIAPLGLPLDVQETLTFNLITELRRSEAARLHRDNMLDMQDRVVHFARQQPERSKTRPQINISYDETADISGAPRTIKYQDAEGIKELRLPDVMARRIERILSGSDAPVIVKGQEMAFRTAEAAGERRREVLAALQQHLEENILHDFKRSGVKVDPQGYVIDDVKEWAFEYQMKDKPKDGSEWLMRENGGRKPLGDQYTSNDEELIALRGQLKAVQGKWRDKKKGTVGAATHEDVLTLMEIEKKVKARIKMLSDEQPNLWSAEQRSAHFQEELDLRQSLFDETGPNSELRQGIISLMDEIWAAHARDESFEISIPVRRGPDVDVGEWHGGLSLPDPGDVPLKPIITTKAKNVGKRNGKWVVLKRETEVVGGETRQKMLALNPHVVDTTHGKNPLSSPFGVREVPHPKSGKSLGYQVVNRKTRLPVSPSQWSDEGIPRLSPARLKAIDKELGEINERLLVIAPKGSKVQKLMQVWQKPRGKRLDTAREPFPGEIQGIPTSKLSEISVQVAPENREAFETLVRRKVDLVAEKTGVADPQIRVRLQQRLDVVDEKLVAAKKDVLLWQRSLAVGTAIKGTLEQRTRLVKRLIEERKGIKSEMSAERIPLTLGSGQLSKAAAQKLADAAYRKYLQGLPHFQGKIPLVEEQMRTGGRAGATVIDGEQAAVLERFLLDYRGGALRKVRAVKKGDKWTDVESAIDETDDVGDWQWGDRETPSTGTVWTHTPDIQETTQGLWGEVLTEFVRKNIDMRAPVEINTPEVVAAFAERVKAVGAPSTTQRDLWLAGQKTTKPVTVYSSEKGVGGQLSNFAKSSITHNGVTYDTVEEAYQVARIRTLLAGRIPDKQIQNLIDIGAGKSPAGWKRHAAEVVEVMDIPAKNTARWKATNVDLMRELLRKKFEDPEMRKALLSTGDAPLEHTGAGSDAFWGLRNGKGENMHGKLLMEVRDELRQKEAPAVAARAKTTLTTTGQYTAKDQLKANLATKFIGRGSAKSSTAQYAKDFGELANTGVYAADDVVFISAEGKRAGRVAPDLVEIDKAIAVQAKFVTDTAANRTAYNIGEKEVVEHLQKAGYVETTPGNGHWQLAPPSGESFEIVGKGRGDFDGMRAGKMNVTNAKPGEPGALGNPHVANDAGGKYTREEAVALFEKDFLARVNSDPEFADWVRSLRGKKIGYYKPGEDAIHLQAVKRWLDQDAVVDTEALQTLFPTGKVVSEGERLSVNLPNGNRISFDVVDEIPGGGQPRGVLGEFQVPTSSIVTDASGKKILGFDSVIALSKKEHLRTGTAVSGTLTHELAHAVQYMGVLTKKEWASLNKVFGGDIEKMAEGYRLWDGTAKVGVATTYFEKIKQFFSNLHDFLLKRDELRAKQVFAKTKSGEIFERTSDPSQMLPNIRGDLATAQDVADHAAGRLPRGRMDQIASARETPDMIQDTADLLAEKRKLRVAQMEEAEHNREYNELIVKRRVAEQRVTDARARLSDGLVRGNKEEVEAQLEAQQRIIQSVMEGVGKIESASALQAAGELEKQIDDIGIMLNKLTTEPESFRLEHPLYFNKRMHQTEEGLSLDVEAAMEWQTKRWHYSDFNYSKLSKFRQGGLIRNVEKWNAWKMPGVGISLDDATTLYKTIVMFKVATMLRIPLADEATRFISEGINPLSAWKDAGQLRNLDKMPDNIQFRMSEMIREATDGTFAYIDYGSPGAFTHYQGILGMSRRDPTFARYLLGRRILDPQAQAGGLRRMQDEVQAFIDSSGPKEAKLRAIVERYYQRAREASGTPAEADEMFKAWYSLGYRKRGGLRRTGLATHRFLNGDVATQSDLDQFWVNTIKDQAGGPAVKGLGEGAVKGDAQGLVDALHHYYGYFYDHPVLGKHWQPVNGWKDTRHFEGELLQGRIPKDMLLGKSFDGFFDPKEAKKAWDSVGKMDPEKDLIDWRGDNLGQLGADRQLELQPQLWGQKTFAGDKATIIHRSRDVLYSILDYAGSKMNEFVYADAFRKNVEELSADAGAGTRKLSIAEMDQIEKQAHFTSRAYMERVMFTNMTYGGEEFLRNIVMFLPAYRQFATYWAPYLAKHPLVLSGVAKANRGKENLKVNMGGFEFNLSRMSFLINQSDTAGSPMKSITGWLPSGAPLLTMPVSLGAHTQAGNTENIWGQLAGNWPFEFAGEYSALNSPFDKLFYGLTGKSLPWPFGTDSTKNAWRAIQIQNEALVNHDKKLTGKEAMWRVRMNRLLEGGWNFLSPVGGRVVDEDIESMMTGKIAYNKAKNPAEVAALLAKPEMKVFKTYLEWQNLPSYEQMAFMSKHPEIVPYAVSGYTAGVNPSGGVGLLYSKAAASGVPDPEAYVQRVDEKYRQINKFLEADAMRKEKDAEEAWWKQFKAQNGDLHEIARLQNEYETSTGAFGEGGNFFIQGRRGQAWYAASLNTKYIGINDPYTGISNSTGDAYRLAKFMDEMGGAGKALLQMSPNYEMYVLQKNKAQQESVTDIVKGYVEHRMATRLTREQIQAAGYTLSESDDLYATTKVIDRMWNGASAAASKYAGGFTSSEGRDIRKAVIEQQNALMRSSPLYSKFFGDNAAALFYGTYLTKAAYTRPDYVRLDQMNQAEADVFKHLLLEKDPDTGQPRLDAPYLPKNAKDLRQDATIVGYVPQRAADGTTTWMAQVQLQAGGGTITGLLPAKTPKEAKQIQLNWVQTHELIGKALVGSQNFTELAKMSQGIAASKSLPDWAKDMAQEDIRAALWQVWLGVAGQARAELRDTTNEFYGDAPGFSTASKFGARWKSTLIELGGTLAAASPAFATEWNTYNKENEMVNAILNWFL